MKVAGRILVLNGTSSSGKTSVARAMQDLGEGPLLYLSLDAMIATLPPRYTGAGGEAALGYALTVDEKDGEPVVRDETGPFGRWVVTLARRQARLLPMASMWWSIVS